MSLPVDGQHELPDPANRGVTRISPIVVERIAINACGGVPGTVNRDQQSDLRAPASKAHADVMGNSVHLSVTVAVQYPAPILPIAKQIRTAVSDEVERLCGLSIIGVDIRPVPVAVRRSARVR